MPRVQGLLQASSATATFLLAVFLGGASTAAAQGLPGVAANKCLAGKTKCVRTKVAGLLACREKCQQDPAKCNDIESACEAKVRAKFDGDGDPTKGCFAKLEAKANPSKPDSVCTTTGDSAEMEVRADTAIGTATGTLEGTPPPPCPLRCMGHMVAYYGFLFGAGAGFNTVCGYDDTRHAGSVVSESLSPTGVAFDHLTVAGDECTTRNEGSSSISDAEQAACAPFAASIATTLSGQPCDVFP
jgi:hypothetical protein